MRVTGAGNGEGALGRSRSWSICRGVVAAGQSRCTDCLTAELLNPDASARTELARDTTVPADVLRLMTEDPDIGVALTAHHTLSALPDQLVTTPAAAGANPEEW